METHCIIDTDFKIDYITFSSSYIVILNEITRCALMLQQLGKCMVHGEENLLLKSKNRSFLIKLCSVNIKLVMALSDPKFLKVQTSAQLFHSKQYCKIL